MTTAEFHKEGPIDQVELAAPLHERDDHRSTWAKWLAVLIILASSIAGLFVVRGLFSPGYLMNFDHPMQQGIIKCFLDNPSVFFSSTWCSHLQAGIAPFQSYPVLFYQLAILISSGVGLELAYKISLMIVWFLLPCFAAFILWRRGHPLGGAFAFALILLQHGSQDVTGPEFFLIVGSGFNQVLGFAFLAITLHFAIEFFADPSKRKLAVLSLSTALYFLSHPTTFLLFIPVLATLVILNRETIVKKTGLLVAYPVLVFLLCSFFIVPVIFNVQDNELVRVGIGVGSPWGLVWEKIVKGMDPVLFVTGVLGLLLAMRGSRTHLWGIPGLAIGVIAAWNLYPVISAAHVLDFAQFDRTVGIMHYLILIGAAIFFEEASFFAHESARNRGFNRWESVWSVALVMLVFGGVLGTQFVVTSSRAQYIITSGNPLMGSIVETLKSVNSTQGRILLEETFGQASYPVNLSSAWGIGPIATQNDLIHPLLRFFRFPYAGTKDFQIMNKRIETLDEDEHLALLEDWNVAYVIGASGPYRSAFKFLPVEKSVGPFLVYKNTVTPVGYFRIGKGSVISSDYRKTWGRAMVRADEYTNVIFKVRFSRNWAASIDGSEIEVRKSQQDLMIISVPEGDHIIEFRIVARWWDYLGIALTMIGFMTLYLLFKGVRVIVRRTDQGLVGSNT